ncbi:MAG: TetR/AcrR family transcriptional regulator [Beutenbergiaceae bacterium]
MGTSREHNRAQVTAAILASARAQLSKVGPAELSLRSVARDVGMVSSAIYRYFPSRNNLLTALLITCYDELGMAAEAVDDPLAKPVDRWVAICYAARAWALTHPHEYALLYGSPVIGYVAPPDTIGPGTRVVLALARVIIDAHPTTPPSAGRGFSGIVDRASQVANGLDATAPDLSSELVGRALIAWASLFGTISFELWGQLTGSVSDYDAWFTEVALRLAADLGLSQSTA